MAFEELQDYFNLVLAILYGLVLLFTVFQFSRIVSNRHQIKSFHSVFLLLCFLWMLLRVILFILLLTMELDGELVGPVGTNGSTSDGDESKVLPLPVYFPLAFFPLELQFATYTLLILFFARVACKLNPATKGLWDEKYRVRYFSSWVVVNVAFLVGLVTGIILLCLDLVDLGGVTFRVTKTITTAVIFTILVSLLSYYGYQLYNVLQDPMVRYIPFQSRGTSVPGITLLTGLLTVVFLCRAVYCVVLAVEYLNHPTFAGEEPVFRFLSLILSELLPTFAILIFFRRIPSSKVRRRQLMPPVFYSSIQDSGEAEKPPTSFFDDPQRYDSDEEKSPSPSGPAGNFPQQHKEGANSPPSLPPSARRFLGASVTPSSYGSFS